MAIVALFVGEYDLTCKDVLARHFERLDCEPHVTLDFSRTEYVDSSVVHLLFRFAIRRNAAHLERATIVVREGSLVDKVFGIVALDRPYAIVRAPAEPKRRDSGARTYLMDCRRPPERPHDDAARA